MQKRLHNIWKEKKEIMILIVIIFLSVIMVLSAFLIKKNRIVQIANRITLEAGQELNLKATDFFKGETECIEQIVFYTENVNKDKVGSYTAMAVYGKQKFSITVSVEDTTAPIINFANRYLFTGNVENTEHIMTMLESIYEPSEFMVRLIRFEKKYNLTVVDEITLKNLVDDIVFPCKKEELLELGTEELPKEEGVYRAVLEVVDSYGNAVYEEVILILDKTGAYIEEVPDKIIEVKKEELCNEPIINVEEYKIVDNVDGKIKKEDIGFELELRDEEKREWIVSVCYIDRAGNESRGEFLIVLKEKEEIHVENIKDDVQIEQNKINQENKIEKDVIQSTQKSENTIETMQNSNQKGESETDKRDENIQNDNQQSQNATDTEIKENNSEEKKPDNSKNQNENEWKPTDDENDISPWEQKVINAGYGVVVNFGDGSYGVLTHNDGYVDGKRGGEILREYLAEYGLRPLNVSGGVIDEGNDWRWYIADNVQKINDLGNEW